MKTNKTELQQLIKEEAMRLKKKMVLESQKSILLKRLNELDECGYMEEEVMSAAPAINPEVEAKVSRAATSIVQRLSPEKMSQLQHELTQSGFLGTSEDEIKRKVEEMLPMSESMGELWDKKKIYNYLIAGGITTFVAGVAAIAMFGQNTDAASNLATMDQVVKNPEAIASLVVAAIGGMTAGISGMKRDQLPK